MEDHKSGLIYKLRQIAEDDNNLAKSKSSPTAVFAIEEPIAWTKIFGYDANRYFSEPEFYFEQTLRQKLWRWENFPDDDLVLTMDMPAWLGHYPEYTFVGMDVSFNSEGVPAISNSNHPLSKDPDIKHLKSIDFYNSGWMPRILNWFDALQKISSGRTNVIFKMTWWRGCLDLAIQLRGYENFVVDTIERPQFVHDLLKWLVEQRCRWWQAYYKHFGLKPGPINIGDDWINIPFITPEFFAEFVLPRYREIEKFHGGISGIHSCGNQVPVQKYLLELKTLECLEVSPWSDLTESLKNIPEDKYLYVALHPNDVLATTPQEMEEKLRFITDSCQGRSYDIATSGLTPVFDDIGQFIDKVRTWTGIAKTICRGSREGGGLGRRERKTGRRKKI